MPFGLNKGLNPSKPYLILTCQIGGILWERQFFNDLCRLYLPKMMVKKIPHFLKSFFAVFKLQKGLIFCAFILDMSPNGYWMLSTYILFILSKKVFFEWGDFFANIKTYLKF